jgi:hypothetical protein
MTKLYERIATATHCHADQVRRQYGDDQQQYGVATLLPIEGCTSV